MVMQLIIETQYRENYGAHDWDGKGECPQYWKNKGGYFYVVTGVYAEDCEAFPEILERAAKHFNLDVSSEYSQEFILDWEVTDDGVKTWDEWETPKEINLNIL
jgi:hypothetical protein